MGSLHFSEASQGILKTRIQKLHLERPRSDSESKPSACPFVTPALKSSIPFDPVAPLPGIYPEEMKKYTDPHSDMTYTEKWDISKSPIEGNW